MNIIHYNNFLIKIIQDPMFNTFGFSILRLDGFLIEDYENKFSFTTEKEAIEMAKTIIASNY